VDKHALLAAITHQLALLAIAVDQPDSGAIAPGDLVQLAPDADQAHGRYFLHVSHVSAGRARGPVLTTHRGKWLNVPLENCARIGRQVWQEPQHGFQPAPISMAIEQRQAISAAYAERSADIARKRAATIARGKAAHNRKAG